MSSAPCPRRVDGVFLTETAEAPWRDAEGAAGILAGAVHAGDSLDALSFDPDHDKTPPSQRGDS